jgi:hypothetical protein
MAMGGRMGNKAAPYPKTDFQEKESILIFESKIDRKQIKTSISSRDKVPNVDGYIEIVDGNNIPIYKFEIQIKTIKRDQKSYYCPRETVNYTNVTTLPILLILVDIARQNVYWKHLIATNARQSPNKKSYIFDYSELDKINKQNDYITKWEIIAQDYINKINTLSENITLLQTDENILPPNNLSEESIIYFQKYIDKINYLLDHEYSIVKQIYFNKYWKLGVSICEFGRDISCGIYGIPHGKTDLFITETKNKTEEGIPKKNIANLYFSNGERGSEEKATDFVFSYVEKIFTHKILLPVGQKMSEEYVYFVVSKCYYMFGLKKSSSYCVDDIANGLNKYLILWISIALDYIDYPRNPLYSNEINVIDIIYLSNIVYFFPSHFPGKYDEIAETFNKVISGKEQHEIKKNIKILFE